MRIIIRFHTAVPKSVDILNLNIWIEETQQGEQRLQIDFQLHLYYWRCL